MRNIEKLLINEEFIKWVKNPTVENDLFWREWLKGNPDRIDDINIARNLVQQFNYKKAPEDDERFNRVLKNILLEKKQESQKRQHQDKKIRATSFDVWVKFAAVILFLLTFAFIVRINFAKPEVETSLVYITKQNPYGQKSTIILPDSTIVTLNSGSSINYPENFIGEYRDIALVGEAYFEVSENKQHPFRVKTGDLITTALGTSFNVRAFDTESNISVSLNTGKVVINNVNLRLDEFLILNPGEKAIYNPSAQEVTRHKFDKELEFSWKDGILVFKKTNLKDFIHTIERWYGVTVDLSGNVEVDCSINGRFENELLEVVLESLEYSREVDYKLDNKKVRLKIKT